VIDLMPDRMAEVFMEQLIPDSCEILASYDHPAWRDYAAITRSRYGKGTGYYLGCMTDPEILERVLDLALEDCGIPHPEEGFPIIVRKGETKDGRTLQRSQHAEEWKDTKITVALKGVKYWWPESMFVFFDTDGNPYDLRLMTQKTMHTQTYYYGRIKNDPSNR